MFIHNKLNQERWTNHIYKNKRGWFHTSFSHLNQSIICRYYFLSLSQPNGVDIIIVHVHWTKLESASIQLKREDKEIWALCSINNNAYEIHSTFSSWSSPLYPQRIRKEIKLFTRESSQQAKEEQEIFLGFLSNYYYYSKKGKLAKSYN